MSGGSECELLSTLLKATEPKRGGMPTYTAYHVVAALRESEKGPVGRQRLSRILGLGEASTRTLMEWLVETGLAVKAGRGVKPSNRGSRLVKAVEMLVSIHKGLPSPIEGGYIVMVRGVEPPEDLTRVYSIRDYLVAEGCRLTVIGGVSGGKPRFPGLTGDMVTLAYEAVEDLGVQGPALIVFVPQECMPLAYSALLRLLYNEKCVGGSATSTLL